MKLLPLILLLALAAQGQQHQRIAIMGTEDDGDPPIPFLELSHLTDKLREIAAQTLPKNRYGIMTQQSIVDRLGSQERAVKECREATCLADLGRKVNADYIAQARIGRFSGNLTIKTELYNVASGNLITSFTGNSKDIQELLEVLEAKAPALFKTMPGTSTTMPKPIAVPAGITIEENSGTYTLDFDKRYLANISTEPEGATLSFNGMPIASCNKTPCKAELPDGEIRIIAAMEQYETKDTTVSITKNNQNINIKLKSNFGVLNITGSHENWKLAINGKAYNSFENNLSPGTYDIKLSHECYEDINFKAGINKGKTEIFNMQEHINPKQGGLSLSAEQDGSPVSEPVFVNGKHVGETPFSGSVPVCSEVKVGKGMEKANVKLEYKQTVKYTHKMPDSKEWKMKKEEEQKSKKEEAAKKKDNTGMWLTGGAFLNMNNIHSNFNSLGPQFNIGRYGKEKFFSLGWNFGVSPGVVDKDEVRRNMPNETIDKISSYKFELNVLARLHPASFLFASGGAGWGWYNIKANKVSIVDISTPILPVGGGIILGPIYNGIGIVIEGSYNILPFKGSYMSINIGITDCP
jgi:hypothetical protein